MDNLELYERVRTVPESAQKKISAGRLKGMTDINPMWRIKILTENFGVCGIGWFPEILRTWLEIGANSEITANIEIKLYVKIDSEWSKGIPGIGGSKLVSKESNGLYTDDECYKKAYTDALSVACKALGIGADIYFAKDETKYNGDSNYSDNSKNKCVQVNNLIADTEISMEQVNAWILKVFGSNIIINNLTDEQFLRRGV